jgi:hypothetical protein
MTKHYCILTKRSCLQFLGADALSAYKPIKNICTLNSPHWLVSLLAGS